MSRYFPAFLDIRDRSCLVVGGGPVAARKAALLVAARARVKVISPELDPLLEGQAIAGRIAVERRHYRVGDLAGVFLAIVATDDLTVNNAVAADARLAGTIVNVVDQPELCDFVMPATLERGDLTVAVSTSGRSPALAGYVRRRLEALFPAEWAEIVTVIGETRDELRRRGHTVSPERWQSLFEGRPIELLAQERPDEVKRQLIERLLGMASVPPEE